MLKRKLLAGCLVSTICSVYGSLVLAQDALPRDNGLAGYHTAPRYRESEAHPLRLAAYILHPVGWVLREGIFRPLSYFASSSETRRSVMGYREPYDYREPECFSADDSIPDCHAVVPFNYESAGIGGTGEEPTAAAVGAAGAQREIYFPDVNFDFDVRKLNDLGKGQTRRIAEILKKQGGDVHIVLQGNADYIGSDAYNEKLGMDRAEAVREELVALGIPRERLSAVTFGETQPIFSEQENWARAVNRRVEAHIDQGAVKTEGR